MQIGWEHDFLQDHAREVGKQNREGEIGNRGRKLEAKLVARNLTRNVVIG